MKVYNLTNHDVCALLGVSIATFYRLIRKKDFPTPVNFGVRLSRYCREEILEWANKQKGTTNYANDRP